MPCPNHHGLMPQPPAPAPPVSPCTGVCRVDPASGLCEGCLRSLPEIAAWGAASADEQRRILASVAQRRRTLGRDTAGR
ncbi:MAG TPA: DUF1289 domain-containing protein [Candidatus Binatia bacterium]|nr:DUF1289 domain-containing protein [Candidatus Binatia bacterium]